MNELLLSCNFSTSDCFSDNTIAASYISTTPFHLFWLILIILLTLISTMIKSWEQKLLRFLLGHFLIVYSRMGVNALTGEALNHPPSGPMPRNCLVSANCSSDLASTSLRTWYLDQFPSPHKICLSHALVYKLRYISEAHCLVVMNMDKAKH